MKILSTGAPSMSYRVRATWLLLLCSGLLLLPADGFAQLRDRSNLLLFNATYGSGKHALTNETIDGWGFSGAFEVQRSSYSIGFVLGWIGFNDIPAADTPPATPENPQPRITGIDVYPAYLTGKYFVGSPQARFYIGAGVGAYTARERRCSDVLCSTFTSGGLALGFPLGFYFFPSEDFFFNVGYAFNWLSSSSVLKNDIGHVINLGLGFQLGR